MPILSKNAIRLFRLAGINVFLHWSWFLVAAIEIQGRRGKYGSVTWNVLEYLALFLIVLTHEFGHALACRQVGGTADKITLWPLGGVAYVNPPQRPGATLWSIAAGPLVNVVLLVPLGAAFVAARNFGWAQSLPDIYIFVRSVLAINIALLAFNILPIYPLDGGQILRSLLWFVLGRGRSLMVAAGLGLVGILGFVALAALLHSFWFAAIAAYLGMSCWGGLQRARKLLRVEKLPRRLGYACPSCRTAPPIGAYWKCSRCATPFDTFASQGECPNCSTRFPSTTCLDCRRAYSIKERASGSIVNGEWNPQPSQLPS